MLFDLLTSWQHVKLEAQTTVNWFLIQCKAVLGFMWYITWLGTFWNSAVPDLMCELRSVVVHVDHIDHDINGVLYLVAIQIHCMSSQLEETQTHLDCGIVQARMILHCFKHVLGITTHSMSPT